MKITRFAQEIFSTPFYRSHPLEVAPYAYAKYLYAKFRVEDPLVFLEHLGIDTGEAMAGFENWRDELEGARDKILQRSGQQGGVSMEDGIILYGVTRALKPAVVIETGVAAGISSSFISAALIENGHGKLYAVDLPPTRWTDLQPDGGKFAWPDTGIGWAMPKRIAEGIGSRRELILEDTRTALPKLVKKLDSIDIFFHDDLHTPDHVRWEYDLIWPKLRAGGVMLSDDADAGWVRFCKDHKIGDKGLYNVQRLTAMRKPPVPTAPKKASAVPVAAR